MSNEEAIKVLNDPEFWYHLWRMEQEEAIELATKALEQQKVGKWFFYDEMATLGVKSMRGKCSLCGFTTIFIDDHTAQYRYCPSCGARME